MTKYELHNRQKVWKALSNFYLDTELEDKDYDYISKVFIETNFSIEQLKDIDLYEVFPLLQMNLLSPVGEWTGFDSKWLNEKCLQNNKKRKNKSFRIVTRTKNKLHYWMRKQHWDEIEIRMKLPRTRL